VAERREDGLAALAGVYSFVSTTGEAPSSSTI
jgi:hypothetical protein